MSERAVPGAGSEAEQEEADGVPGARQRADDGVPAAGQVQAARQAGEGQAAADAGAGGEQVAGASGTGGEEVSDRILTIPNLISAFRLLLVPVVAVLIIDGQFLAAVVALAVAGLSDWVDGVVARWLNQTSQLGQVLDPAADRLFIAVAIIGLAVHDVVPWWLLAAVVGRDLVVGLCVPFLVRRGFPGFPVHVIGKAGTFALMLSFPLLLLAQVPWLADRLLIDLAWTLGWAAAIWGLYLYWSAAIGYLNQFRAVITSDARGSSQAPVPPPAAGDTDERP